jgi:hypothetical protein
VRRTGHERAGGISGVSIGDEIYASLGEKKVSIDNIGMFRFNIGGKRFFRMAFVPGD